MASNTEIGFLPQMVFYERDPVSQTVVRDTSHELTPVRFKYLRNSFPVPSLPPLRKISIAS